MPSDIIILSERIKELSHDTGTGSLTLDGAATGFSAFGDYYSNNDAVYYAITDGTDWETGSGQYISGGSNSITRTALKSTNSDNLVSFNAGLKEVYVTYPGQFSVFSASGLGSFSQPQASGLAFWGSSNIVDYDSDLIWDKTNSRMGVGQSSPQYAIHVGSQESYSQVYSSGSIVGDSGVLFAGVDPAYSGGRQLEPFIRSELNTETGTDDVFALSGLVDQVLLFKTQTAGKVLAGPPSGCTPGAGCPDDYPVFRALVADDIPDLYSIYVTPLSGVMDAQSGVLQSQITQNASDITQNASDIVVVSGLAGNTYTAGSGLTLVGDEFNTAGTGNFTKILSSPTIIIGDTHTGSGFLQYGSNTVIIGGYAGASASGGHETNYIGSNAGYLSSGWRRSNLIGASAGANSTIPGIVDILEGSNIIGPYAGHSSSGYYLNFIGLGAGQLSRGSYNIFVGSQVGSGNVGSHNIVVDPSGSDSSWHIANKTNSYLLSIGTTINGLSNSGVYRVGATGNISELQQATLSVKSTEDDISNIKTVRRSGQTAAQIVSDSGNPNTIVNNSGFLVLPDIIESGNISPSVGSGSLVRASTTNAQSLYFSNGADWIAVSGASPYNWNISDGISASDTIANTDTVYVSGISGVATSYNSTSNIMQINAAEAISAASGFAKNYTDDAIVSAGSYTHWTINDAAGHSENIVNSTNVYVSGISGIDTFYNTTTNVLEVNAASLSGWTRAYVDASGKRSTAGDTDNGIVTWVTSDDTFAVESNITFDGSTLTVGADGTGKDVKFYGDTTGSYLEWDQSEDRLNLVSGVFVNDAVPADDTPTTATAAITLDLSLGSYHNFVIGTVPITTVNFNNAKRGQKFICRITQHGSAAQTVTAWKNTGSDNVYYTGTTNAVVRWAGDLDPTMSTTVGHTDVYGFLCTDSLGSKFDAFIVGQDLPD